MCRIRHKAVCYLLEEAFSLKNSAEMIAAGTATTSILFCLITLAIDRAIIEGVKDLYTKISNSWKMAKFSLNTMESKLCHLKNLFMVLGLLLLMNIKKRISCQ